MKPTIFILVAFMVTERASAQLQPSGPLGGSGPAGQGTRYPYSRTPDGSLSSPAEFPARPRTTPYPSASPTAHIFNENGYCIRCGWERDFVTRENRPCVSNAAQVARTEAQAKPQDLIERCIASEDASDVTARLAQYVGKSFDVCGFITPTSPTSYTLTGGKIDLLQQRAATARLTCYTDQVPRKLVESLAQDKFNANPFALLKVKVIRQEAVPQFAAVIEDGIVFQPLLLGPLKRQLGTSLQERKKQEELDRAQAQQVAIAAKQEAAVQEVAMAEEKADAQAFRARASTLFGKFLDDPSWKGRSLDLRKITRPSATLKMQCAELTDTGKNLRARFKHPETRATCEKTFPLLEVPLVWALATESFASGEAAKGMAALEDFISNNSDAAPELGPFWDSLQTFYKFCREQEKAAQPHLQSAKELSAIGKSAQAIKEYEMAHSLFPDQEIARAIAKLRKESLGL